MRDVAFLGIFDSHGGNVTNINTWYVINIAITITQQLTIALSYVSWKAGGASCASTTGGCQWQQMLQ